MRSKIVITGLALVVVIGIGVGVGLLASRPASHLPPAPSDVADNSPPQPVHIAPEHDPVPEVKPVSTPAVHATPLVQPSNFAPVTTTAGTNEWEEKIDDIVGSDEPDTNKVQKLFALFPKLPPDGQEEAAQHLSNLVDDEDYAQLGNMLKNDKLPEGVLDELLADVLNRPNALKLPALLTVASDPNHAKHEEAKDLLELYLGEDYGTDWNSWGQHMTNWMQQNPE